MRYSRVFPPYYSDSTSKRPEVQEIPMKLLVGGLRRELGLDARASQVGEIELAHERAADGAAVAGDVDGGGCPESSMST